MGARIPETIRKQVLVEWLAGITRDQIANNNKIGTGTVSGIIKGSRRTKKRF